MKYASFVGKIFQYAKKNILFSSLSFFFQHFCTMPQDGSRDISTQSLLFVERRLLFFLQYTEFGARGGRRSDDRRRLWSPHCYKKITYRVYLGHHYIKYKHVQLKNIKKTKKSSHTLLFRRSFFFDFAFLISDCGTGFVSAIVQRFPRLHA